ncbi:MAG: hypothetical protein ACYCX4_18695 [Bacillota bacterium]
MAIFCSPQCEEFGAMCQICYFYDPAFDGEIWRMDIEYREFDFCTKYERRTEGWFVDCKDFTCPGSGGVDWKDRYVVEL